MSGGNSVTHFSLFLMTHPNHGGSVCVTVMKCPLLLPMARSCRSGVQEAHGRSSSGNATIILAPRSENKQEGRKYFLETGLVGAGGGPNNPYPAN